MEKSAGLLEQAFNAEVRSNNSAEKADQSISLQKTIVFLLIKILSFFDYHNPLINVKLTIG